MDNWLARVVLCLAVSGLAWAQPSPAAAAPAAGLDLVFVLDNSGSMRQNDPQFLTRAVVSEFIAAENLPKDMRVGVVVFGDRADLVMPLSPLNELTNRQRLKASLERLDYSAKLTDTAAAIERALYELSHDGRADAERAIVLMTDGIIDLGDRAKDAERKRWVTTELADASARARTRIFGVAFTDTADFQLIQSLGQRTGGDYYRILKPEEVKSAFARIADGLARPSAPAAAASSGTAAPSAAASTTSSAATRPAAATSAATPVPVVVPGQPWWLFLGPALGLMGLTAAIFVLALFWRSGRAIAPETQATIERDEDLIPEGERAYLQDLNDPPVLPDGKYELTRRITKIGRMKGRPGVLRVDQATVSAQHAEIRYQKGNYYLVDTESVNRTRIDDGAALVPYVETPLKSGRTIAIANCKFEFVVEGADKDETQAWILDPTSALGARPVAKKGQGGNYFTS